MAHLSDQGKQPIHQPLPAGLNLSRDMKKHISRYTRIPHWLMPSWAIFYVLSILAAYAIVTFILVSGQHAYLFTYPFIVLIISRQLRALECMVHEGSHYNWNRKNARLNDLLTNILSAFPTINDVRNYRPGHFAHHREFGTEHDTDLNRYIELDMESLARTSWPQLLFDLTKRMPQYINSWFNAIQTDYSTFFFAILWHALVLFAPVSMVFSTHLAAIAWLITFLPSYIVVLSFIRFIGEAEEHIYGINQEATMKYEDTYEKVQCSTVFDSTIENTGLLHKLLIHPFGDSYHVLHHMFPAVPGCRLGRLHRDLLNNAEIDYARRVKNRTIIPQDPIIGVPK